MRLRPLALTALAALALSLGWPTAALAAAPTATVVVTKPTVAIGETTPVTITFSEPVRNFSAAAIEVENGTLMYLSGAADQRTFTAVFSPSPGIHSSFNYITVRMSEITDAAGTPGTGTSTSNNFAIDTIAPTATVGLSSTTLHTGETATLTTSFSEAVTGFRGANIVAPNLTVSAPTTPDGGLNWTSLVVANPGVSASNNVLILNPSGIRDLSGNAMTLTPAPVSYAVDTEPLTAAIALSQTALIIGTTPTVTFTFSEPVTGFTSDDVTTPHAQLLSLGSSNGGLTWMGTLTPNGNTTASTNVLTLDLTGVTTMAGISGAGTSVSTNYSIDTQRPTAHISVAPDTLLAGQTATVTIEFSEPVRDTVMNSLVATNATLTSGTFSTPTTWTTTLTPVQGVNSQANQLALRMSQISDLAGNAGGDTVHSNSYSINTLINEPLTVEISLDKTTLAIGDTGTATFTFSEPVNTLSVSALAASDSQILSAVGSGATYTVTFVPNANTTSTGNLLGVNLGRVTRASNNQPGIGQAFSDEFAIDTVRPVAALTLDRTVLRAGDTATATITFSEPVTGLTAADFSAAHLSVDGISAVSRAGTTFTATVTPNTDTTALDTTLALDTAGVTDLAGNSGAQRISSSPLDVTTQRPGATIVVATTELDAGLTSPVTISFTEPVTGFSLSALSTSGGTLAGLTPGDGGMVWTATLTPTQGPTATTAVVTLDFRDIVNASGNSGVGTVESNPYTVAAIAVPTPEPTVDPTPEPTVTPTPTPSAPTEPTDTESPTPTPETTTAPETTAPAATPTPSATAPVATVPAANTPAPETTAPAAPLASTGAAPIGLIALAGLLLALGAALRVRMRRVG